MSEVLYPCVVPFDSVPLAVLLFIVLGSAAQPLNPIGIIRLHGRFQRADPTLHFASMLSKLVPAGGPPDRGSSVGGAPKSQRHFFSVPNMEVLKGSGASPVEAAPNDRNVICAWLWIGGRPEWAGPSNARGFVVI